MLNAETDPMSCGCGACDGRDACDSYGASRFGLVGYPVAMVYAPLQQFDHIFDLETALRKGTIFEELDLPFECGRKAKGGCCNG